MGEKSYPSDQTDDGIGQLRGQLSNRRWTNDGSYEAKIPFTLTTERKGNFMGPSMPTGNSP